MESVSAFTQRFAQLVWLLVHKNDQSDGQKDVLRQTLSELSERGQALVLPEISLAVASAFQQDILGQEVTWLSELSVRMSAHSVRSLEFARGALPRDILGVARALSANPVPGDEGVAFDTMMLATQAESVTARIGKGGFVRRATPALSHLTSPPDSPAAPVPPRRESGFVSQEFGDSGTPQAVLSGDDQQEHGELMHRQMEKQPMAATTLEDLLRRLEAAAESGTDSQVVDEIAREAEERGRQGLWVDLAEVLDRLHSRADTLREGERKRAYCAAIRRLETPHLLQGLARLLPRRRNLRDSLIRILSRSGEAGADALIDLLVSAENAAERRTYRTALSRCPAAVPALRHLLGDSRWFVVRNAAQLLGDLTAPEAEVSLIDVLGHRDPRVRRAVASALAKLGGTRVVLALLQAVQDHSPDVRLQVVLGLAALRNPRAVPWLVEALDREQDPDVQLAMLGALGKMPTEESVARLARVAGPGGILLRKTSASRLQAVEALGEAGTPSARSVLRTLLIDRDQSVREAAERALAEQTAPVTPA